ncbi:hypothetical protein ACIRBX_01450 [Kitasatospora sp. NPDC096147]|uniref:hypothetical protein n=1 Tax=Kitasatospora sp. NPDC096147 TaxID=3364093 RepID=UPI003805469C
MVVLHAARVPRPRSRHAGVGVVAVSTGVLAPWLTVWAGTRTEAADRHLADAVDDWTFESELTDLRLGFYDELEASAELLPWLLSLGAARIGVTRFPEVERIARTLPASRAERQGRKGR